MADTSQERDPFVLVLIDGDGMIFDDNLIKHGENGGRQAASLLWNAISECVHNTMDLQSDIRIVTRIYANVRGLGDVCHKAGILAKPEMMEDFARGFTGSKQLFDFVDVGIGKDRADDKLSGKTLLSMGIECDLIAIEIFKLHLYDCHCRHIFFGCSHDNGYARLLEDVAEPTVLKSITLLEGVPFERELLFLKSKYQTTRFDGLFRTSKINIHQQQQLYQTLPSHTNGAPPGLPPPPSHYQSPYQPSLPNSPPPSVNGVSSSMPTPQTWATTAMNAKYHAPSPPPSAPPTTGSNLQVQRNRHGQRIDPLMQYDLNEVRRIKKLKMCNVHFLRGDCPYDPCTHDHFYEPNKNELQTLRYVSRLVPCKYGTECDDPKCIYGHRCPNDVEGKKECRFGENCRFPVELHGIDRTPVRMLKVGGK